MPTQEAPFTGPTPKPGPRRPYDFTKLDELMRMLQHWRSEDHEDNLVLCRSYVIEIIEGVKALHNRK